MVLVALSLAITVGLPAALRLRVPGLAFLYGSGIVFLAMEVLAFAGWRWSVWPMLTVAVALSICFAALTPARPRTPLRLSVLDGVTLAFLALYALYATGAAPWHWDYWSIWGLKARVFADYGGIDWRFLQSPSNAFAHPEYPLLVPLTFAYPAVIAGQWLDRWLGLIAVAFVGSIGLVVRQLAACDLRPALASCVSFAITALAASQYVGLAEVPLIAFGTAGVVLMRRAVGGDQALWIPSAIMLGFAANAKAEGLTLVLAAAVALVVCGRWRDVGRLWPAAVIAAPWMIARSLAGLSLYLTAGSPLERVAAHAGEWRTLAGLLLGAIEKPWCWIAIILALPLVLPRDRFVVTVVIVQLFFFIGAFLLTPYDLRWHVTTAWDRLSRQLLVLAAYPSLLALAAQFSRTGSEDAQARSDD